MKKNDEFELNITGVGKDGEGIGHFEGMTFFVTGALPGDVVRALRDQSLRQYFLSPRPV